MDGCGRWARLSASSRAAGWSRKHVTAIAIAVTVVAIVTPALVVLLARDDRSIGDIALIELRTRDVLSRDPPLSGVYSRYGWSHPGPLMYYVYAIPYRLFGGDADALRMTVLLVNVLVLGALAWLVRRRGRGATVAILGATAALVWGMLPHSLTDGWNVTIAILPMMLALVGCWCALCKDRFGLAVAAVSTAFVFQAHIGFGVVVVPVFLATVVWAAIDASRSSDRDRLRRVALVGGGCLLLFVPVLYDMVDRWPGNLGRIVKWSVTNDEQKIGAGNALRLIGRTASLSFPFHPPFPGGFLLSIDNVTAGVVPGALLIALVAAFVVAIRRGWRDEKLLCGTVAGTWVAGLVAAMTITRPLAPWLIAWLQPLGWITYAAIALVTWRVIQAAFSMRAQWYLVPIAVTSVALIALIAGTAEFARSERNAGYLGDDVREGIDDLTSAAAATAGTGPLFIEFSGDPTVAGSMFNAVVNRLDAGGHDVCIPPERAYQFGSSRVCTVEPSGRLIIRQEPIAMTPPDGTTAAIIVDPLSKAERREADILVDELARILEDNGLSAKVPLLHSPLVDLVLADDPPSDVLAVADDVRRLSELRQIPGARFGLYQRLPAD